jgi:hypothetical protein
MYQSSYRRFLSLVFAVLASVLVIGNAILPRVVTAVQADPVISSGRASPPTQLWICCRPSPLVRPHSRS